MKNSYFLFIQFLKCTSINYCVLLLFYFFQSFKKVTNRSQRSNQFLIYVLNKYIVFLFKQVFCQYWKFLSSKKPIILPDSKSAVLFYFFVLKSLNLKYKETKIFIVLLKTLQQFSNKLTKTLMNLCFSQHSTKMQQYF